MAFDFFGLKCVLVCAAYLAAGLVDGVSGGGGLITVPALMAIGVPTHLVAGTNQCSAVLGCLESLVIYARDRKICYRAGIAAAVFAIAGGILGAKLNMFIPEEYLKIVMLALMPFMVILLLLKKDFVGVDRSESLPAVRTLIISAAIGLAVGVYQGFYGPGAGTLYIMAFAFILKLGLVKASGTAKLATFFGALSSCVTYAFSGCVIWRIVLAATVFYMLGSFLGAKLALKKGAKAIRPFLFFTIGLLFITLIVKL